MKPWITLTLVTLSLVYRKQRRCETIPDQCELLCIAAFSSPPFYIKTRNLHQ
jgi:hypothetical protein